MRLNADDEAALEAMIGVLPERPLVRSGEVDCSFELEHNNRYELKRNGENIYSDTRLEGPLRRLEMVLHQEVPLHAREAVFVHAGVVGWQDRVLLLPGYSCTGKSTLTQAMIRLGAEYYSDEYAVILDNGKLAPYRRRLTIRDEDGQETRLEVTSTISQEKQARVHLVAFCSYVRGGRWHPSELSTGQGILGLFSHTVTARQSPDRDLKWLEQGTRYARFLQSDRDEADLVAARLLEELRQPG